MTSRLAFAAAAWCALLAAGVPAQGALALVVLALVAWWCRRRPAGVAGRVVTGHAHGGSTAFIARHEAGHVAAARALGGRVRSVRADRDSGLVQATIPGDPTSAVAFLRAGRRAVRSGRGCSEDDGAVRKVLREVPRAQRGQVERDGDRLARRIVSRSGGAIRRYAATIERTGTL